MCIQAPASCRGFLFLGETRAGFPGLWGKPFSAHLSRDPQTTRNLNRANLYRYGSRRVFPQPVQSCRNGREISPAVWLRFLVSHRLRLFSPRDALPDLLIEPGPPLDPLRRRAGVPPAPAGKGIKRNPEKKEKGKERA